MGKKRCKDSSIIMTQQMNPQDANPAGNVHGGVMMKFIDTTAGAVAVHHARANAVTASIDRLDFHYPVFKDMNFPGSGLHWLLPKAKGRWAIKVSGNWRLTFDFKDGDARNVVVEDYH